MDQLPMTVFFAFAATVAMILVVLCCLHCRRRKQERSITTVRAWIEFASCAKRLQGKISQQMFMLLLLGVVSFFPEFYTPDHGVREMVNTLGNYLSTKSLNGCHPT